MKTLHSNLISFLSLKQFIDIDDVKHEYGSLEN